MVLFRLGSAVLLSKSGQKYVTLWPPVCQQDSTLFAVQLWPVSASFYFQADDQPMHK